MSTMPTISTWQLYYLQCATEQPRGRLVLHGYKLDEQYSGCQR